MDFSAANHGLWDVFVWGGVIAALLLLANLLTRKIAFVRKSLMPVAALAGFALAAAGDLAEAIAKARAALPDGGVVLLSPGAPSFGQYKDYVARGRHFAELAGFDPDAITAIPGLGLA